MNRPKNQVTPRMKSELNTNGRRRCCRNLLFTHDQEHRNHLCQPTKQQNSFASNDATCWNSLVAASLEHMPWARGRNAESGFSGSPSSRLPLHAKIPQSTKCQNCAILHLAVPAEKRSMAYQRGSLKK